MNTRWKRLALFALVTAAMVGTVIALVEWFTIPSFVPSDYIQRQAAVGSLDHLSPLHRMAFGDETGYAPVPQPRNNDWLARHRENGQTFDEWVNSRAKGPNDVQNVIYLQPLGAFTHEDLKLLRQLRSFAEAYFQMEARLSAPIPLVDVELTRRVGASGQEQLLTGDLLTRLASVVPEDAYCMLGITMTDLYPKDSWNFVFGQARLYHRVGVYSLARYSPEFYGDPVAPGDHQLLLLRAMKVLAHETGHMFGIHHDIYYYGLLNGSNNLAETDRAPIHVGPVSLRKLHRAIGFDILERYRDLEQWYRGVGLSAHADWVSERATLLESVYPP